MKKIILSAAFIALGTLAFAQKNDGDRKAKFEEKRTERLAQLKSELNLTDAQVAQIKVLQDKKMETRKAEMQVEKADRQKEMKAKMDQNDKDMKSILTPEQYKKWQEKKEQKMQERKDKMATKK